MSRTQAITRWAGRRWRVAALAGCVVWLLLQNSILLAWYSSQYLGPALVVLRALARVGAHLVAQLWMLPVAVILGVALALSAGSRQHDGERVRRVSHV